MTKARNSSGRKRVELAKIEKESNLQVTFSKRRASLFKKASELCILTSAEVFILVFSPSGKKVFSFGHPGVAPVVDRFLRDTNNIDPEASDPTHQFIEACRSENIQKLNMQLAQLLHELEIEKKKGEEHARMKNLANNQERLNSWESPTKQLTLPQLEQLKVSLEALKKDVSTQKENLISILQAPYQPPSLEPLPTNYAYSSAIVDGCFAQPMNPNVPYLDQNLGAGTNVPNVDDARFSTGP